MEKDKYNMTARRAAWGKKAHHEATIKVDQCCYHSENDDRNLQ